MAAAPERGSEFNQRGAAANWFRIHSCWSNKRSPKLPVNGIADLNVVPRFLSHLSLLSWRHPIHGTGAGASVLFCSPAHSHHPGRRYRAIDNDYGVSGRARRFPQAPKHRPLDAAPLAVCLGNRRYRLCDALPPLPVALTSAERFDF